MTIGCVSSFSPYIDQLVGPTNCWLQLFFVRVGIYNSVADYNSTWRVLSVCVSVCLCMCVSWGKLCYWVTFERFELEGWNFLWCLSMKNLLGGRFFFLIRPPQPPQPPYPLCNPPQYTNFANFGPIWMKLCVEVKNGQQSSNPELFFYLTPSKPPNQPTPYPRIVCITNSEE